MQTEGRTPLTVKGRKLVLLIALAVLVVDQITKLLAVAFLDRPIQILGSLFQLNLVRNPGAAFSFATSNTYLFTIISTVAVVLMIRYASKVQGTPWIVVWGLILGGASGNLVDRVLRSPGFPSGHVVDFLQIPYWPIFNVADSAITVAVVIGLFFSLKKNS